MALMVDLIVLFLTYLAYLVEQSDGFRETFSSMDWKPLWDAIQSQPHAPYCPMGNGDDGNYSQNVLLWVLERLAEALGHSEIRFELDCW